MTIKHQSQLIRRIQTDLRKQAAMFLSEGNLQAHSDCEEQAASLACVLDTLRVAAELTEALALLTQPEGSKL